MIYSSTKVQTTSSQIFLAVLVSLLGIFFLFSNRASASTFQPGDLIKAKNQKALYYFGNDLKRHLIPNEGTYHSWFSSFSSAKTIDKNELTSIPSGSNVTVRPCTKLIKIKSDPKIYVIEPGGVLRWIPTQKIAKAVWGPNWSAKIIEIPKTLWADYVLGDPLNPNELPNGCLVKNQSSPDVYLFSNGKYRKIKNKAAFLANNYKWHDIIIVPEKITASAGQDILDAETNLTDMAQTNIQTTVADVNDGQITNETPEIMPSAQVAVQLSEDNSNNENAAEQPFSVGTYLICEQWQAICDHGNGIEKIKFIGGDIVLLSVGGGDATLFPSNYIPKAGWINPEHTQNVVNFAHKHGLKVYAWLSMPNQYWLEKYPDWIQVDSNGTPTDYWKIIPPSRVLGTPEVLEKLKGVVGELVEMGFDGIDVNDNFQFLPDASFDDFTVNKFKEETKVQIVGETLQERAQYIKSNKTILSSWRDWRAEQTTKLLALLQQHIRDNGFNIPLRPHLMTPGDDGFDTYGYDWKAIAGAVDMPFLMMGYGEEEVVKEKAKLLKSFGAKKIAASLYLDTIEIGDEVKLGNHIKWLKEAGVNEVFFFTWAKAEEKGLWNTLHKAVMMTKQ